jgi:hypothetical protein
METKINDITKIKEQLQTERELYASYMNGDRYFVGKFESKESAEEFIKKKTYSTVDNKALYFYMLGNSLCYMFSSKTGSTLLGETHQYEIFKINEIITRAINYGVLWGSDIDATEAKLKLSNSIQEYLHMELLDMYYKISTEEPPKDIVTNMSIPQIVLKEEVK